MIQPTTNTIKYEVEIDENSLEIVFDRFVPLPHISPPEVATAMVTKLGFQTHNIQHNTRDIVIDNLFLSSPIPNFLLFAFVDSEALYGNRHTNPFLFKYTQYEAAYLMIDSK